MNKEILIKLLLEGKSMRDISKILGMSRETVRYWVTKYEFCNLVKYKQRKSYNFDKIDTPQKAYVLGFILADGNISLKNEVELSVCLNDKYVLEYISNIINGEVLIDKTFEKKTRRFPRARLCKKINDILTFAGGRLKKDRHYPKIRKDLERYLLLGFFDGDGCLTYGIRKDRNKLWYKISFTSQLKLLQGVQQLLYKEIQISTIIRPKSNEDCYVLEFSNKNDILTFLDYIYPDDKFIILQRKYLKNKALRLELEEFGETTKK